MDLSSPKVSVCVITYNQRDYIANCLESILCQSAPFSYEVIVGDDGSTDGTVDIVRKYAARYPEIITPIFQPQNTGGSTNNLMVHAAARGEYVAHIDGDDIALPDKLRMQSDALDENPHITSVWHRVDYFDDQGGFCPGDTADLSSYVDGLVSFSDAIRLGFVGVYSSLMYRRRMRTPISLDRNVLDLYFTWDLLSKGPGMILDQVLGQYRIQSKNSITQATRRSRSIAIDHANEFLDRFPERRGDFAIWAVSFAVTQLRHFHVKNVRASLALALRTRVPVSPLTVVEKHKANEKGPGPMETNARGARHKSRITK